MNQRPAVMDLGNMIGATERAKRRVDDWLKLAADAEHDTRKGERLAAHRCRACFYSTGMGGAAMTHRPCMCCGADELYGSTNTDVLCLPCAVDGSLCKKCGGDLEMRAQRRAWPTPKATEKTS